MKGEVPLANALAARQLLSVRVVLGGLSEMSNSKRRVGGPQAHHRFEMAKQTESLSGTVADERDASFGRQM